jgi:hypothetical protein
MTMPERIWATRDPLTMAMFAAWLNVTVDQVPDAYKAHTCESTMHAWDRVADAARKHLRVDLTPSLSSAAMKRAAVDATASMVACRGQSGCMWMGKAFAVRDAIEAVPDPSPADLLREAARVPEIATLLNWLRLETRDIVTEKTMFNDAQPDIYVKEILKNLEAITGEA